MKADTEHAAGTAEIGRSEAEQADDQMRRPRRQEQDYEDLQINSPRLLQPRLLSGSTALPARTCCAEQWQRPLSETHVPALAMNDRHPTGFDRPSLAVILRGGPQSLVDRGRFVARCAIAASLGHRGTRGPATSCVGTQPRFINLVLIGRGIVCAAHIVRRRS